MGTKWLAARRKCGSVLIKKKEKMIHCFAITIGSISQTVTIYIFKYRIEYAVDPVFFK